MMLSLKSFSQIVQDMGAILQNSATVLVDVSVGSVARAIIEANAGIALWMQWVMLQVLQTTRASTSNGADLDSWMADFGITRLPAAPAAGMATFYRYSANFSAPIPPGVIIKSGDGSLSFTVEASSSLSLWDSNSGAYVVPPGVASANVPIVCNTPGAQGNLNAGAISVIASSLPGFDQVSNLTPLTGGLDAESDASFRGRFVGYLASLSSATPMAVRSAVANVRQGLTTALLENTLADGTVSPGRLLVIIDDGFGSPSEDLIAEVSSAIENVRPVGTLVSVVAPTVITVNVGMSISLPRSSPNFNTAQVKAQQAVQNYLNTIGIGDDAAVSRIIQAVYVAIPDATNVMSVLLNGVGGDISSGLTGVIKSGTIAVTINGY